MKVFYPAVQDWRIIYAIQVGVMVVNMLDSRLSGPVSSADCGHCVVFLGKTRHSHPGE